MQMIAAMKQKYLDKDTMVVFPNGGHLFPRESSAMTESLHDAPGLFLTIKTKLPRTVPDYGQTAW